MQAQAHPQKQGAGDASIRTPADIEAIERVPLAERDLPVSTYDLLRRTASQYPDRPALSFFLRGAAYDHAVTFSYREMLARVHQTANVFYQLGVGPEDVVSLILPNLPQTFFSILGGEAAGIVNPINPLLEPAQMAGIMKAAETKVLVTLAPFFRADLWQKVSAVIGQVPTLETVLQVDLSRYLPWPKRLVARMLKPRTPRGAPVTVPVHDVDRLLARAPADRLVSGRLPEPDDVASYFHTGGTTGTPKLAQHTHRNEVFDAWSCSQALPHEHESTFFCGLPLFHMNGVLVTGLLPWLSGDHVVLGTPQGYRGEGVLAGFWKMVAHYRINFFSGVPTVYSALLDVPISDSDLSSLEFALCGAASMPVEVFKAFEKRTGVRILEGYGLTEGTCVSSVNPPTGERRIGSIGLRLPYQEMKTVLLDAEGGYVRDSRPDEIGVVAVRGPNVFPGYREAAHNEGIWIDTGDLGRQDEEGYFWLTGRRKELIIRGGHNIDPRLIEDALHEHPAVALAAAVGRPDARVGEVPVAYVQLNAQASVTSEELLSFARARITERAAVPKAIHFLDELPQTAIGKIFKPALQRREVERVYAQVVEQVEGVAEVQVTTEADRTRGTVAHVRIRVAEGYAPAAVEADAAQVLGAFTTPHELALL